VSRLPVVLATALLLPRIVAAQVSYDRTIQFSGLTWRVKASPNAGPGPNAFSDSVRTVRVDTRGRLRLRIVRIDGVWRCAEVVSVDSLGYGTYRFYLDSKVDHLDPNVVLGLFTWNDADPSYNNREIDIEFSRWGAADDPTNAQYVVQPFDTPGNLVRFTEPPMLRKSTHSFVWRPTEIDYQSLRGHLAVPSGPADVIAELTQTSSSIPPAGGENVRINLWLYQGSPPTKNRSTTVVIDRFEFVPAS